jgi:hypothetical protein
MPNRFSLGDLTDLSNYPNAQLAKLVTGGLMALEPTFAALSLLPYFILCWISFITLDKSLEARSLFPSLLGENGRASLPKVNEVYKKYMAQRMESIMRERAQRNSPIGMKVLEYASEADPPAALVNSFTFEFRKMLYRLRNLNMPAEDALQTAQLHLTEKLQPLRESREKLLEAFFAASCNYTMKNVYSKLVDDLRCALAQKRRPTSLIKVGGLREFEELSSVPQPSHSPTPEDVVAVKQAEEHIRNLVVEAFPGDSRKFEIIRNLLRDPDLSSADLARQLGCSKKTIDRDLAKLRGCQTLRAFLGKSPSS